MIIYSRILDSFGTNCPGKTVIIKNSVIAFSKNRDPNFLSWMCFSRTLSNLLRRIMETLIWTEPSFCVHSASSREYPWLNRGLITHNELFHTQIKFLIIGCGMWFCRQKNLPNLVSYLLCHSIIYWVVYSCMHTYRRFPVGWPGQVNPICLSIPILARSLYRLHGTKANLSQEKCLL